MLRNLPPLCKAIVIGWIASAAISLFLPSIVQSVLPLYPPLALRGLQIWRFATYPFFFIISGRGLLGGIINLAWMSMMVVFFGGELESIIHTKRLTTALAITVIGGGLLFCLLSPDGALAGPGIITMFVLGGFAYMWPKREISIFGLFWVKAWMIAVALFLLSIIPFSGLQLDTSASNLFAPIVGAVGAILFLHITYRQYSFGRSFLNSFDGMAKRRSEKKPTLDADDPRAIEHRIDAILDKISKSGMQSLSKEEREFLLRHSK
jgi:hypothetical protein